MDVGKLSELGDPELSSFGKPLLLELSRLCSWDKDEPNQGERRTFIARFMDYLRSHENRDGQAEFFARHIRAEIYFLWVFIKEEGVESTNSIAERAIRPGVMRLRHRETERKGRRWVERTLSIRKTRRV